MYGPWFVLGLDSGDYLIERGLGVWDHVANVIYATKYGSSFAAEEALERYNAVSFVAVLEEQEDGSYATLVETATEEDHES